MLDAGVDVRDVQIAARHADPRTPMRYDPARKNLDRHYILAAYMAFGTSRARVSGGQSLGTHPAFAEVSPYFPSTHARRGLPSPSWSLRSSIQFAI
jgi:hypothetical protein